MLCVRLLTEVCPTLCPFACLCAVNELLAEGDWEALRPMMSGAAKYLLLPSHALHTLPLL